jgi:fatty acid desaturase
MSPTSLDKNTSNNKTVNRDIISQQIPRPLFLLSYPLMIIGFLLLFGGLLFFLFSLVCWIFGWLGLGGVHVLISIAAFIVGAVAIIMGLSLFGVE